MTNFEKTDLDLIANAFRGSIQNKIIFDIFFIYHLVHHLSFLKTERGRYSCLPSKDSLIYSLSLFKGWFHLLVYMYIHLLNLKPINCLKIVMLTCPGFFFQEANLSGLAFGIPRPIRDRTHQQNLRTFLVLFSRFFFIS